MRYCNDSDIEKIRESALSNLTIDSLQPEDFQKMAGQNIEMDLVSLWYSGTDPFNARLLPYSFDYDYKQRVSVVSIGERVDKKGIIYEKINSDLSINYLTDTDFTDTDNWKKIECTFPALFRDLAAYQTLFLIYRYQAGDSETENTFERQRDYFLEAYRNELARILEIGIDYDLDESGVIDTDNEKRIISNKVRPALQSVTVW